MFSGVFSENYEGDVLEFINKMDERLNDLMLYASTVKVTINSKIDQTIEELGFGLAPLIEMTKRLQIQEKLNNNSDTSLCLEVPIQNYMAMLLDAGKSINNIDIIS